MTALHRRHAPATLVATVVALLAFCAVADARTFTLNGCPSDNKLAWVNVYAANEWRLLNNCPAPFNVFAESPSVNAQQFIFPKTYRSGLKIKGATATMQGSGGGTVGKRQGVSVGSGTMFPLDGSDYAAATTVTWGGTGNPGVPNAFDRVVISGKCSFNPPCPPSPGLNVSNVTATYDDVTAPGLIMPAGMFNMGERPFRPGNWNAAGNLLSWEATDYVSSGLTHTRLESDLGEIDFDTGCGWSAAAPVYSNFCPDLRAWKYAIADDGPWQQGTNSTRLTAYDMAGNSTTKTIDVKYDSIPPDPPQFPYAEGEFSDGWQSEPLFDIHWYNLGDASESESESGIETLHYQLIGNGSEVSSEWLTLPGIDSLTDFEVPHEGRWTLTLRTKDRAGNTSDPSTIHLNYETLILDAPMIEPVDWVNRDDMLNGLPIRWRRPANHDDSLAGICGYAHQFDPAASALGTEINLPPESDNIALNRLLEDGRHRLHLRAISCAGVPGEIAVLPIDVDLSRPTVSHAPASDDWLPNSQQVIIDAEDETSGVDHIAYSVDGAPSVTVNSDTASLTLEGGSHVVDYHAVDKSGNHSKGHTAAVHIDALPPAASIDEFDPSRPSLVQATVTDRQSGIASAWLEFESLDGGLASSPQFSRTEMPVRGTHELRLSGRLPAAEMAPGRYRLKVVAIDRAGNRSVTGVRTGGGDALAVAPLLDATALTAGFASKTAVALCGKSTPVKKCARRRTQAITSLTNLAFVDFGHGGDLFGKLARSDGEPLAGVRLRVLTRLADAAGVVPVADAVTDAAGVFSIRIPSGPSRLVEVRYAGSETSLPATSQARMSTHGSATLTATPRVAKGNRTFALTGRVLGAGAGLPRNGKLVVFEYRARSGWVTFPFAPETFTRDDGKFRAIGSFPDFRRSFVFRVRARLRAETGWPYATGYSRTVKLVSRPR